MKWRSARIYRQDLALSRPIPVKQRRDGVRQILRLVCETLDGRFVQADCAPLPGFHNETFDQCRIAAQEYFAGGGLSAQPVSLKTTLELMEWQLSHSAMPPLSPLSHFENSALLTIPVDQGLWAEHIQSAADARVCKVKIGASDLRLARAFLCELASSRTDRMLRIDCNQALETSGIEGMQRLIKGLPLAYIEEPFASLPLLLDLSKRLPLALDESLGRDPFLDQAAKAWVIKPNTLGWFRTLERFQDEGPQDKILSNCFESYETLQTYAFAYSRFVSNPDACGLGTAFYFANPCPSGVWSAAVYSSPWPEAAVPDCLATKKGELLWSIS
ncbi:MAG: hypothetical protein H7249_12585 [Chitinophagaceae bacterium]|nr:hypothetical protein [Oligoflexus sp.]